MSETRPTLDELLADPLVQLVMKRSHSRPEDVRLLMQQAGERAARRDDLPPAHVIAAVGCEARCCA
jgi:hypothetical protein